MACSSTTSVFTTEDRYIIRLRKISDTVSTKFFRTLLHWVTPNWKKPSSFQEYLKVKQRYSIKKFKSDLKPSQKNVMKNDVSGNTYDISLLYLLILYGNEDLADIDDPIWNRNSNSLEYAITSVKNMRNQTMHNYDPINEKEFFQKTEDIRQHLRQMILESKSRLHHISEEEVKKSLEELDKLINHIRDDPIDPQDFNKYKYEKLFQEKKHFLKEKGRISLHSRHKMYDSLNPVSNLLKESISLKEIFMDLLLQNELSKEKKIDLVNILEGLENNFSVSMCVLEGIAGSGKTTITKKILQGWMEGKGSIIHLNAFDLLIHFECRDHIDSFRKLLAISFPEAAKSLDENDLIMATLDLKTLIIVDGFDEANTDSMKLINEIFQLKRMFSFTIFLTTRPEALPKLNTLLDSLQMTKKHVKILGISDSKRLEFVSKYFDCLKPYSSKIHNINDLLQYIQVNSNYMGELWKLPYNLCVLTVLWVIQPDTINSISTASDLHWEMHKVSLSKLRERLITQERTQHLQSSILERKISNFIFILCQVSLTALANNEATLNEEMCQELTNTCLEQEIPFEEMAGTFLKTVNTASGQRYSYPHKGVLDFCGAYYIWLRITAQHLLIPTQEIAQGIGDYLTAHSIPTHVIKRIKTFAEEEFVYENNLSSLTISNPNPRDMDEKIHQSASVILNQESVVETSASQQAHAPNVIKAIIEGFDLSTPLDTAKYQNLVKYLIGMICREGDKIKNKIKIDALRMLQESGVNTLEGWLSFVNEMKCDDDVSSFVCQQPEFIKDITFYIKDGNLQAYFSLFQAMCKYVQHPQKIGYVHIVKNISEISHTFSLISKLKLPISEIVVTDENISTYYSILGNRNIPLVIHNVDLRITKRTRDLQNFCKLLQKKQTNVSGLELTFHFKQMKQITTSEKKFVNEILQRYHVTKYVGQIFNGIVLKYPLHLKQSLHISLLDDKDYVLLKNQLFTSLAPCKSRIELDLSVSVPSTIDINLLFPLLGIDYLYIFITDVGDGEIEQAALIAKKLSPISGDYWRFRHIHFPRCTLTPEGLRKLILELKGVPIRDSLVFPSSCQPSSEVAKELGELALEVIGMINFTIQWGKGKHWDNNWWDLDSW